MLINDTHTQVEEIYKNLKIKTKKVKSDAFFKEIQNRNIKMTAKDFVKFIVTTEI